MRRYAPVLVALSSVTVLVSFMPPATGATGWQKPVTVQAKDLLTNVSCSSSTFCAAMDYSGHSFTFDGSAWSSPTRVHVTGFASLSCAGPTFCMAVDVAGDAEIYDGSAWSTPTKVGTGSRLSAVSCTSAGFCLAGDYVGDIYLYTQDGWASTPSDTIPGRVDSLSCSSETFCMAINDEQSTTDDGSTWSQPQPADSHALNDLLCVSSTFCMAVDQGSRYVVYRNGLWGSRHNLGRAVVPWDNLSCGSVTLCVGVNESEHVRVWHGHAFDPTQRIDRHNQDEGGYANASCVGSSFCMVVNYAGDAVEY